MKVLMVGNDLSVKGGITSVISQLLAHDWDSDGVEMKFIPTYVEIGTSQKILFFVKAYLKIKKCLKHWKPDVVHLHMSYKGSFTRKYLIHQMCQRYGVPDIIHLHGSEFEKWYLESGEKKQAKIRKLLRETSAFIVLGNQWNSAVKKIEPTTRTLVVSNTVSIPKEKAKWNDQSFQILFLGVLIKRKGVADLLQAMKMLKDAGVGAKLHLIIAGSGQEEDALKQLSSELEVDEIVDFVGWIDGEKKKELLSSSQMLVLPSYNEGLPVVILEAISYGLPVVATDVGDISSAVQNGKNGFLFEPGDVNKMVEHIEKFFNDKKLYETFSKESKKLAREVFSDAAYYNQIENCYKKVIIMKDTKNAKKYGEGGIIRIDCKYPIICINFRTPEMPSKAA